MEATTAGNAWALEPHLQNVSKDRQVGPSDSLLQALYSESRLHIYARSMPPTLSSVIISTANHDAVAAQIGAEQDSILLARVNL